MFTKDSVSSETILVLASIGMYAISFYLIYMTVGTTVNETYYVPLAYVGVATGLLVLPRIKYVEVGKVKVELEKKFEEFKEDLEIKYAPRDPDAIKQAAQGGNIKAGDEAVDLKKGTGNPVVPDDPQKGQWGGKDEANGRKLTAKVTPDSGSFYRILLTVKSVDSKHPLTGKVTFHLHDSFKPDVMTAKVIDGVATLTIFAWGAFTVGVEADDNETKLELDLADLKTAPKAFREL